ncbi:MAG TPA: methenyltetrahydromethanopterin cyclohydrolase, partial [Gemmatimonadaceae bacterium]|nr:methenyltetrahydromethanopterin cyclohydrolase [Gemmatimonadaceae bacterium]
MDRTVNDPAAPAAGHIELPLDRRGLALNERSAVIADRAVMDADALRIALHRLPSGARVIDAGIDVPGGLAAGLLLAEMCMGGLGHVRFAPITVGGKTWSG